MGVIRMSLLYIPNYMKALIVYSEGKFTVTEATEKIHIDGTNLSRINKLLDEKGLITYEEVEKRKRYIIITDKGKEIVVIIHKFLELMNIKEEPRKKKIKNIEKELILDKEKQEEIKNG